MTEWVMGLNGVLLCLFEGYCIQSFFGRFAVPKLCRIRNAGWATGIAWIVIRAFSEGLFSDTDSISLIMELLFTFCTLFVFCVCWYQGNILLKIFLAVQFISLRELSFWTGYSLIYIGNEMIEALVNKAGIGMAYRASAAFGVRNVKPAYEAYESENYRIVPDNEAGCFDIYNKQGERIGAFDYSDIKVRQDSQTGKQFLVSEHGTMSYDAMVLDGELKDALQNVIGVETLETEELSGFPLKTHSGTGIQYLVREGEEGRGGKVLLQSEADRERY